MNAKDKLLVMAIKELEFAFLKNGITTSDVVEATCRPVTSRTDHEFQKLIIASVLNAAQLHKAAQLNRGSLRSERRYDDDEYRTIGSIKQMLGIEEEDVDPE
jgi:hypothetical protein